MTKSCPHCNQAFDITARDIEFYKTVGQRFSGISFELPLPSLCPDCRQRRRMAWRNERKLYNRKSDLSGKEIISIYSTDKPFKVYATDEWWSDAWDPLSYGKAFDFSRSFFDQFRELQLAVPRLALYGKANENSDYTNHTDHAKNTYLSVDAGFCENIYYSKWVIESRFCSDCYVLTNSELCYECQYCDRCYHCSSLLYCDGCTDSAFLYDCKNCRSCLMSAGLRNKEYHIFNKPYPKEEYLKIVEKYLNGGYIAFTELKKRFHDEVLMKFPHKANHIVSCEDCTGDDLKNSKRLQSCFGVQDAQDCAYCADCSGISDSWDAYESAFECELQYETHACNRAKRTLFSSVCYDVNEVLYCDICHNSSNLFGCVGLRNKQYCILNKQYSKEEYEELVMRIIEQMRKSSVSAPDGRESIPDQVEDRLSFSKGGVCNGASSSQESLSNRTQDGSTTSPFVKGSTPTLSSSEGEGGGISEWGEFFPLSLSPFAYNETVAMEYFPLTKEEAITIGAAWKEEDGTNRYQGPQATIPDHITDVPDEIAKHILTCEQCGKNYRLIIQELRFYRQMNLPVPRQCFNCRHLNRMKVRNPRKLFSRSCSKCGNDISSTYSGDRPEKVYCEECYLKEVY